MVSQTPTTSSVGLGVYRHRIEIGRKWFAGCLLEAVTNDCKVWRMIPKTGQHVTPGKRQALESAHIGLDELTGRKTLENTNTVTKSVDEASATKWEGYELGRFHDSKHSLNLSSC